MRTQVGTVTLLQERVYPRYPVPYVRSAAAQLTTDMPFVEVEAGVWPVYHDETSGLIYWEMSGELIQVEPTFQNLGDGTFLSSNEIRRQGQVIFRSTVFTPEMFRTFVTTDPIAQPGEAQRLVFDVDV